MIDYTEASLTLNLFCPAVVTSKMSYGRSALFAPLGRSLHKVRLIAAGIEMQGPEHVMPGRCATREDGRIDEG